MLEFGDAVFHDGAAVVIAPDRFLSDGARDNEGAKGVAGHVDQLVPFGAAAFALQFTHRHEAPCLLPDAEFEPELAAEKLFVKN